MIHVLSLYNLKFANAQVVIIITKDKLISERALSERLEATDLALRRRIARPADTYLGAFALAMQTDLAQKGPMYRFVVETLEHRPQIGSSHLLTLITRAFQARALTAMRDPLQGPVYPNDYTAESAWHQGFTRVLNEPDLYGPFHVDVWTREPQSNVMDRYKNTKAFAVLARKMGRLGTFTMLDVGCSLNVGLNYLASGIGADPPNVHDSGISTPEVIRPQSRSMLPNLRLTAAYNRVINSELPLTLGVGIDRSDPRDAWDWAYACSFNPGELMDTRRVDLFNKLITTEYPNVGFYRADFAEMELDALAEAYPDAQWGIVNISAMLYQANPERRATILHKARQLASDFVVVSDFAEIDHNDPRGLNIIDDWNAKSYPWVTAVWDVRERSPKWHEIILSTDGHVSQITIGKGRIATADGRSRSLWTPLSDFS